MARRSALVATVVVVTAIAAGGIFAGLAAGGDLPWQNHVAGVASDGSQATAIPSPTGSTGASPSTTAPAAAPSATFVTPFPHLPALERPTNMLQVPGQQRFVVTLQDGRIVSFANDANASTLDTVLDQRAKTSRDDNEEGLLGLAFDPAFATNGYIYVYYSAKPGDRRTVLARLSTSGSGSTFKADPASELILLTVPQPFGNHKGGQLVFGPDSMLYLGLGDGGSGGDPMGNGQDIKKNLLGSIIRIDVRNATKEKPYGIPPDNPFAGSPSGEKPETWAYGLRNPWRFSFTSDGTLVAGDVGQGAHEEVDIIEKGKNYGWNIMEGFSCYKPSGGCNKSGLTLPVIDYPHDGGACSITGGYVYEGKAVTALANAYVYGDYCTGEIWAIPKLQAPNPQPVALLKSGPQISSFARDAAGELYVLTFDGKVERIDP